MAPLHRFIVASIAAYATAVTALPGPRVPDAISVQHHVSFQPQRPTPVPALHQPDSSPQQNHTSNATHPSTSILATQQPSHPARPTPIPPPLLAATPGTPLAVGNISRINTTGTTFQAAILHDRTLLLASTTGTGGIDFLRSNDSGKTWRQISKIGKQTGNDTFYGMSNPTLSTFLNNGTEYIYCAYEISHRAPSGVDYRQIDLSVSTDGGRTWTYRSSPSADPQSFRNSTTPFLRTTLGGDLQVYYSFRDGNEAENLVQISKDGGTTYGEHSTISGDEENSIPFVHVIDGWPSVAVAPQSRNVIAALDSNNDGVRTIEMTTSKSDGRAFLGRSTPKLDVMSGARGYSPSLITVEGTMVLGYQALPADSKADVVGHGRIVTSTNDGSDWANGIDAIGGSPYISLLGLDDHTFICFALDGATPGVMVQTYRIA